MHFAGTLVLLPYFLPDSNWRHESHTEKDAKVLNVEHLLRGTVFIHISSVCERECKYV